MPKNIFFGTKRMTSLDIQPVKEKVGVKCVEYVVLFPMNQ